MDSKVTPWPLAAFVAPWRGHGICLTVCATQSGLCRQTPLPKAKSLCLRVEDAQRALEGHQEMPLTMDQCLDDPNPGARKEAREAAAKVEGTKPLRVRQDNDVIGGLVWKSRRGRPVGL